MGFCSVNHLSGCGVDAKHNAKHSPSLACKNKTENDSRLLKNSEGNRDDEWTFCRGQETRIRMIRKNRRKLVDYCLKLGDHKQRTLKHRNKVDRNAPITSKDVFPKRSAKMIDGTAKRTARYKEFG